jgi:hypothetical protein
MMAGEGLNSASRWSGAERSGQAETIGENEGVRNPDCCVTVCNGWSITALLHWYGGFCQFEGGLRGSLSPWERYLRQLLPHWL